NRSRITQNLVCSFDFSSDLGRVNRMLCKATPARLLSLCVDVPFNVQLLNGINLPEIESHLRSFFALEQTSDDGFHYRFAVHWDWNTDAERFVDFSGFLDEDIRDDAVNYVIGAIKKDGFDFRARLSKP